MSHYNVVLTSFQITWRSAISAVWIFIIKPLNGKANANEPCMQIPPFDKLEKDLFWDFCIDTNSVFVTKDTTAYKTGGEQNVLCNEVMYFLHGYKNAPDFSIVAMCAKCEVFVDKGPLGDDAQVFTTRESRNKVPKLSSLSGQCTIVHIS